MRRSASIVVAGLLSGLPFSDAGGQGLAPPLDPIDQAVEDVGALSASLRDMRTDLRVPSGFQQVYRVPGRDDLLMRVNGGVYAVFPRSAYARTRRGPVALIPPDTVFHIGLPWQWPVRIERGEPETNADPQALPVETRHVARSGVEVDSRMDHRIVDRPTDDRKEARTRIEAVDEHPGRTTTPTIVTDAAYRERRIEQLLHRAASTRRGA